MIADLHLPQWEEFLHAHAEAMAGNHLAPPFDFYPREEAWTRAADRRYPVRPTGDAYRTARAVYETLAAAPYQGSTTVTLDPPAAHTPGAPATLTATFRNLNGLRATGPVDLTLTLNGLAATPLGSTSAPSVPPGGSTHVSWQITANPPAAYAYTLSTRYGPAGQPPVTVTQHGTLPAGATTRHPAPADTPEAVFP